MTANFGAPEFEPNSVRADDVMGQIAARTIVIQAYYYMNKTREKPRFERVFEAPLFEALPVLYSIFNEKCHGRLENRDLIFYDPESTKTTMKRCEKIIYMEELISWRIKEKPEYEALLGWSSKRLWTYTHCLVRFLSKKPLPYTSYMTAETNDVENVRLLAKCLGASEESDLHLRKQLVPFIKLRLALPPADVEDTKKPTKRPASPETEINVVEKKARAAIDSTADTSQLEERHTSSGPTSPKKENLAPMPEGAYIRLNESSSHCYLMNLKEVKASSHFLGGLLDDLCEGNLVGSRYSMVGGNIDGLPTLLWDGVITYFMNNDYGSTRNASAAIMNSWQADERWVPMSMFVERMQTEEGLRKARAPIDHRRAEWFNKFVGACV
ncbi:hypothetical protein sscle_12g087510 [Sclerotinia sclerotiorum 1980 UF-70]|uniref:Uncharacterized protein n=1 Tax=Sclerotinia sclerotiorum (strain ATCC 18683 / 1980 / Ss-1) TaxID=665079 RepID=A0A1D9QGG1_SCLS1|nr:hypothetical protein sscle_12g087510 [Sclerotinia sclerotiorum 1980 UF-70]